MIYVPLEELHETRTADHVQGNPIILRYNLYT